jgi:hypothetical protein
MGAWRSMRQREQMLVQRIATVEQQEREYQ